MEQYLQALAADLTHDPQIAQLVPVRLLPPEKRRDLEALNLRGTSLFWMRDSALGIEELVDLKRVVILGNPGSGKTTLLRHLALRLSGDIRRRAEASLPVLLNLSDYAGQPLAQFVEMTLSRWGLDSSRGVAAVPKCYLLDGLENVLAEHRDLFLRYLRTVASEHSTDQIIVTCRANVWDQWPLHQEQLSDVGFLPLFLPYFDYDQAILYIQRFCKAPDQLIVQLNERNLWELVEIPQTLRLVVEESSRNPSLALPSDTNSLYDQVEERWFQESASRRSIPSQAVAEAAQLLALGMEALQQNHISQNDLVTILEA